MILLLVKGDRQPSNQILGQWKYCYTSPAFERASSSCPALPIYYSPLSPFPQSLASPVRLLTKLSTH